MTSLVTNHASRSRVGRSQQSVGRGRARAGAATRSVKGCVACDISSGKSWYRRQCSAVTNRGAMLSPPSSPSDCRRLGDVEVQARRRDPGAPRPLPRSRAQLLGDQVLEDREQELVLAGEEPVEGLQRDAGFLHELLGRELRRRVRRSDGERRRRSTVACSICRARERCTVGDRSAARSAHPSGVDLGRAHDGDSTTTGIGRSVRVWYTS